MATDVEKLVAQLEVRQRQFERQMERAARTTQRQTGKIQRRFAQTNKSATAQMAAMGRGIFASLGPILGASTALTGGALISGIRSSVSQLSVLGKQARDTGIDVEELQGLMRGVARGSRVTEDQFVNAMVAFNRRVGEALHGTGELATASKRYGFSVTDSNGKLRSQSELLRDISSVMQALPNQQERAALGMQAFGDVGRILAQVLAKGPEYLEQILQEARAAGHVIDSDLIQRAEELDDKFDALGRTASTAFKRMAVGAADFTDKHMTNLRDILQIIEDDLQVDPLAGIFGSLDRARALLGDDLFDSLYGNTDRIAEVGDQLSLVADGAEKIEPAALSAGIALRDLARILLYSGDGDAAQQMHVLSASVLEIASNLAKGEISADEFGAQLGDLNTRIEDAISGISGLDRARLEGISAQFSGLINLAAQLESGIRSAQAAGGGAVVRDQGASARRASLNDDMTAINERRAAARAAVQDFVAEQERLRSLTAEQIELEREMGTLRRDAGKAGVELTEAQIAAQARLNLARQAELGASAGGAGGGAAGGGDDFTRAVEAIRERTAALDMEAVSIVAAAQAGREYGDAMEFARTRAQLLLAAQKSGLAVTPELEAAVDRLAAAHDRAGQAAKDAADKLTQAEGQARTGAQAITGIFMAMGQGADQAKQALANLLMQIAQAQMMKGLTGVFPGLMEGLGGLMEFAEGGYTGDGAKHQPKGVVHGGEYVFSKKAVQAAGVDQLELLHRRLQGFQGGGLVGAATGGRAMPASSAAGALAVSVGFDDSMGAFRATIRNEQGQVVAQALQAYDREALPNRVQQIQRDPRRRG